MAKENSGLTPMMKQFFAVKAQHPEALLLFRCGDFYETYGDDALTASKILGIVLTRRSNSAPDSVSPTTPSTPTFPGSYGQATKWPSATSWKTRNSPRT